MRRTRALAGLLLACSFLLLLSPTDVGAAQAPDEEGVRRAALDYIEGFYEGDPDKLRRGLHPEMVKYGYYRAEPGAAYEGMAMSFAEAIAFAERVRSQGSQPGPDAPKEVILLDVQDQTAAAKIVAWWGTDYLHLARIDGEWKILHVIWQSPPPESTS